MKDIIVIALGIISIGGSLVTIIAYFTYIKYRVEKHEEREKEFRATLDKTTNDLGSVINRLGVVVAEQAIINKFTTNLLEQLTQRQEVLSEKVQHNEKLLADYSTILNIIKDMLNKKELK